jgi:serine/threonine-protein kinase
VEVLGEGGFGIVYKVERAGLFFALKLLRARALEGWGQREINILRHLAHPNVVGFHAYDRWPVPVYGYLYFVMEFVEGRTLEDWALDENPSARWVARVLLEVLLALAAVHQQGVFHRDLKRDNILIRDLDARPMLVDFGIGWLAGEPTVTRDTLPPGTYEYRSPEAICFEREPANKGSTYRPDEGDDLWAMGVTLYWLLTDVLPFGNRHARGLNDRIVTHAPKAPREVNSRVPKALSTLCLRMLAKERSARFSGCAELCGALEAALASAELDGRWDLPLMDPDAPDKAPTEQDANMVPRDAEELEALQWNVARPRRGRKAARKPGPEEKKCMPVVDAPAPLQAGEPPAPAPLQAGEPLARVQMAEAAAPAPQPPAPPARAVRAPPGAKAPGALARGLSRLLPSSVGLLPVRSVVTDAMKPAAKVALVVVAVLALASAGAFVVRARRAPASPPAPVPTATPAPGAFLPHAWLPECPTPRACPVTELAVSPETTEAGGGAAPVVAPTPASATAMPLRKQESRLPPQEKPASVIQLEDGRCKKWLCLAAAGCSWVLVACPGAQVRSTLGPEDCPAGAVKTMREELRIPLGEELAVGFPGIRRGDYATVRGGFGSVELAAKYGELDEGTVLTGDFILGEKVLHGRFKRAQTPGGKTYPVCMEFRQVGRGVDIEDNVGADAVKVNTMALVRAVISFQEAR